MIRGVENAFLFVPRQLGLADLVAMDLVKTVGQLQETRRRMGSRDTTVIVGPAAAERLHGPGDHLQAIFGAATLIIAISALATLLPTVSIMYAALSVSKRDCSIMMRASAMRSIVTPC